MGRPVSILRIYETTEQKELYSSYPTTHTYTQHYYLY